MRFDNFSGRVVAGGATLVAGVLAAGSVLAADLPSRVVAPLAPPPPAFTWTGAYLGLSLGGDFLNNRWTTVASGLGPGVLDNTINRNMDVSTFRFGGYGGYNIQYGMLVVGMEGDFAGDFGGRKSSVGIPGTLTLVTAPIADSINSSADFDASIRGRFGYLLTPTILAYATGGVAFQDIKNGINCPATGAGSWCTNPESGSDDNTRVGYTVGAGLEARLWDNWIGRVEYRFSGYGSHTTTFFPNGGVAGSDALTVRTRDNTQIVNIGLAYKFQ